MSSSANRAAERIEQEYMMFTSNGNVAAIIAELIRLARELTDWNFSQLEKELSKAGSEGWSGIAQDAENLRAALAHAEGRDGK